MSDRFECSPPDTLYEGGFFRALLSFPPDFPLRPPKMKFLTEMWHPNSASPPLCPSPRACPEEGELTTRRVPRAVYKNGELCISILHEPGVDQYGYEDASERWLPVHTVESIVRPLLPPSL